VLQVPADLAYARGYRQPTRCAMQVDLLIHNADWVANPDETPPAAHQSIAIRDGWIVALGAADELAVEARETLDARGLILIPGLINTHQHFLESLTRAMPAAQNDPLLPWLSKHYPFWAAVEPSHLAIATRQAAVELLRSGCTTVFDHNYLWPNGCQVEDQIEAMQALGLRFHVSRGSISLGQSRGGVAPDQAVEDEGHILRDSERVIDRWHDPSPGSRLQVALAPGSPYSVSAALMRDTAALARDKGVRLHTHLAESRDEVDFCRQQYRETPVTHVEGMGWLGPDVWFAHMIHPSSTDLQRLASHGCGISHCPCSNMRLGNGIAPVRAFLDRSMPVGIGVDGGASNDAASLLAETRQAMLLQRVTHGAEAMTAREALTLATAGGAKVLGRTDIGRLEVGMTADIAGFRLDALEMAGGAVHDPLGALVFCPPPYADLVVVDGEPRVRKGEVLGQDLGALVAAHNEAARTIVRAASQA